MLGEESQHLGDIDSELTQFVIGAWVPATARIVFALADGLGEFPRCARGCFVARVERTQGPAVALLGARSLDEACRCALDDCRHERIAMALPRIKAGKSLKKPDEQVLSQILAILLSELRPSDQLSHFPTNDPANERINPLDSFVLHCWFSSRPRRSCRWATTRRRMESRPAAFAVAMREAPFGVAHNRLRFAAG
jgi:hypothetical protein